MNGIGKWIVLLAMGLYVAFGSHAAPPDTLQGKDFRKLERRARKGNVPAMLWLADYYTAQAPDDSLQVYWSGQAALRGDTLAEKN